MKTTKAINLFMASRHSRGLSPRTIKWYQEILECFNQQFPKLPKSPEAIDEFLSSCPGKDERRHGYFRTLRCFYHFLEKRHKTRNPIRLVDPPKRTHKEPNFLTIYDMAKLLTHPHDPRIKAALRFLADTGARLGELYNLKLSDFRLTPWGYVTKVTGKTGARFIPVSLETYHIMQNALPFPYLKHRLGRKISLAFKEAGILGTAHTLRHTFGTLWDGDEFALQRILGHSSLEMVKLYRHLKTDVLCRQHHKYSPTTLARSSALQEVLL